MKIEIVHDMVCSWCPIGYNNLKQALARLEGVIEARISFLPFQLSPDMSERGEEIIPHLMRRMHWSKDQVLEYRRNLLAKGEQAGMQFDFSKRTHYYNTRKAHCLMHWAEKFDKQVAFNEALIEAYFRQGRNIGDDECLLDLCEAIGLDRNDSAWALRSGLLGQEISHKLIRVDRLNIMSIPAFIFDEIHFVSGSNSPLFFENYLMGLLEGKAATV